MRENCDSCPGLFCTSLHPNLACKSLVIPKWVRKYCSHEENSFYSCSFLSNLILRKSHDSPFETFFFFSVGKFTHCFPIKKLWLKNPGLDIRKHNFFQAVHSYCGSELIGALLTNETMTNKLRAKNVLYYSNIWWKHPPALHPCHLSMPHFADCLCIVFYSFLIQPTKTIFSSVCSLEKKTTKNAVFSQNVLSLPQAFIQWGLDFLLSSWEVSTCLNICWIGLLSWGEDVWHGVLQAQSDKWVLGV